MNNSQRLTLEQVNSIKKQYESILLKQTGVIGVGIGQVEPVDSIQNQHDFCIIVTIENTFMDRLPAELEGAPVKVVKVGTFRAFGD